MVTYSMVALADQNGRTYESNYGEYSKKDGFVLNETSKTLTTEALLDILFHEDIWKLSKKSEPKKMTKKQIEEALGYEINIEDEEESCNSSYYDDFLNGLELLFGKRR